jgi:hypothetical protein
MTSPDKRTQLTPLVGLLLLCLHAGCPALARPQNVASSPSAPAWTKDDHELASQWLKTLDDLTDRLDDCTYKGLFSNADAVPDACHAAYVEAPEALAGRPGDGLLLFLAHGCAKWHSSQRTKKNERDCEELGRGYRDLEEAMDRATLANVNSIERRKNMLLGNAADRYVASVNPKEVSEEVRLLQQLNTELEKPQVNPGAAFMAGTIYRDLDSWIINHCPAELAWGLPARRYATALSACSALEPELRRFEPNVLRLLSLSSANEKGLK